MFSMFQSGPLPLSPSGRAVASFLVWLLVFMYIADVGSVCPGLSSEIRQGFIPPQWECRFMVFRGARDPKVDFEYFLQSTDL